MVDSRVARICAYARALHRLPKFTFHLLCSGPLISPAAKKRVEGLIASAEEEGGRIHLDGRGISVPGYPNGNFVGPTIVEATTTMRCYRSVHLFFSLALSGLNKSSEVRRFLVPRLLSSLPTLLMMLSTSSTQIPMVMALSSLPSLARPHADLRRR
jgi:hypothetical protein